MHPQKQQRSLGIEKREKNFRIYLEGSEKSFYICTLNLRNAEKKNGEKKSEGETKINLEN